MRTVLALDEMLAAAVKKKLGREVETEVLDRVAMRGLGRRRVVPHLRELVTTKPSVLVIGGRGWDALPMLARLRLPQEVPVVLLTPEATWETKAEANRLGVVTVIPLDDGDDTGEIVASEIHVARSLSLEQRTIPVLIRRSRRVISDRGLASLLRLAKRP